MDGTSGNFGSSRGVSTGFSGVASSPPSEEKYVEFVCKKCDKKMGMSLWIPPNKALCFRCYKIDQVKQ